MTRTPLRRSTPLRAKSSLRRTGRLRAVSAKRRRLAYARAECRRIVRERAKGRCQLRVSAACAVWGTDTHEILTRARGGSITDPDNCLWSCRVCHDWTHAHPAEAASLGFLKSQFSGGAA